MLLRLFSFQKLKTSQHSLLLSDGRLTCNINISEWQLQLNTLIIDLFQIALYIPLRFCFVYMVTMIHKCFTHSVNYKEARGASELWFMPEALKATKLKIFNIGCFAHCLCLHVQMILTLSPGVSNILTVLLSSQLLPGKLKGISGIEIVKTIFQCCLSPLLTPWIPVSFNLW